MTALATIPTKLGVVTLHHEAGRFATTRPYTSCADGRELVCTILQGRESARRWYDWALERGTTAEDWPEEAA